MLQLTGPPPHEKRCNINLNPAKVAIQSGRPKGARNFSSDLRDELTELVTVKDGDDSIEVTRQRAIIKVLVKAALEVIGTPPSLF